MERRELNFEVLNKNRVCERVHVDFKTGKIEDICYTDKADELVFGKREPSDDLIYEFFEERAFDRNRPDIKEILEHLGLSEYEPEAIVRITHGRLMDDFTWIRFAGEKLIWEDVEDYYSKQE